MIGKVTVGRVDTEDTGVYIGRPSLLGNPYRIDDANNMDREECIKRFGLCLDSAMRICEPSQTQRRIRNLVMHLARRIAYGEDITLLCYCAPLKCHGDMLAVEITNQAKLLISSGAVKPGDASGIVTTI